MDHDIDVLTRTLYGEARGESDEGRIAVAWVVKNRAARPSWWGRDIAGVCTAPYQFSCWNKNDPNREKLISLSPADPLYQDLSNIASKVVYGEIPDPTNGATHYKVRGTKASWDHATAGMVPVSIGHHDFYRLGPTA